MPAIKQPGDVDPESDPFFRYLARIPSSRNKLERVELLLECLNAKAAEMLDSFRPPQDHEKN